MGRTGKMTTAQKAHLNTYLDEFTAKLDAGVRGIELTRWKQSAAAKALASPSFQDLDVSGISRTEWFKAWIATWHWPLHLPANKGDLI